MSFKDKKVAFVFPGQGAQYIGMGMDFVKSNPNFEAILDTFDKNNKTTLKRIISEGPEDLLKETKYTQPAILFHSIIAMKTLQEKIAITPDYVAGHSLGEFSALVANGVLSLEDAMYLVHRRGQFMIEANQDKPYAMAAILGLKEDQVKKICEEASKTDIVVAANFNTPVQTVISGSKDGVERAIELAKEAKAKRVIPLVVGGPFHSPLIEKAGLWLQEEMEKVSFSDTQIPVVSNVDFQPTTNPEKIKENLAKQVTSSVLWVDCVKKMVSEGVEIMIEFGPKKVLCGMIKSIDKSVKLLNIDKLDDIEKVISELESV